MHYEYTLHCTRMDNGYTVFRLWPSEPERTYNSDRDHRFVGNSGVPYHDFQCEIMAVTCAGLTSSWPFNGLVCMAAGEALAFSQGSHEMVTEVSRLSERRETIISLKRTERRAYFRPWSLEQLRFMCYLGRMWEVLLLPNARENIVIGGSREEYEWWAKDPEGRLTAEAMRYAKTIGISVSDVACTKEELDTFLLRGNLAWITDMEDEIRSLEL